MNKSIFLISSRDKFFKNWVIYFNSYLKIILLFTFFSILIFSVDIYYKFLRLMESTEMRSEFFLKSKKIWFQQFIYTSTSDLRIMKQLNFMKSYLRTRDSSYLGNISEYLVSLANSKNIYDQLRFIDETGKEKIRINNRDQAYAVPNNELENLSKEDYFSSALHISTGRIFISDLVLSRQSGIPEIPYRPVLHLAAPLYNQYEIPSGVFILTVDGTKVVEKLKDRDQNFQGYLMLVSSSGKPLISSDFGQDWRSILDENNTPDFKKKYPDEWNIVTQKAEGSFRSNNGLFVFTTFLFPDSIEGDAFNFQGNLSSSQSWKLMTFLSDDQIQALWLNVVREELLYVIAYFLAAFFMGSYLAWLSGRKKTREIELQRSEKSLKAAQKILNTGNWVYDLRHDFWLWSEELFNILEFDIHFTSASLENLLKNIHENDLDYVRAALNSAMERQIACKIYCRLCFPGGKIKNILIMTSFEGEGIQAHKIHGVVQDVTELKNSEEELRTLKEAADTSNQAKTEFLSNIVKEIIGSLSLIADFSETLGSRIEDKKNLYYLKSIQLSSNILTNLFNDIIELSNIERTSSSIRKINLPLLIGEVRELFRLRMIEKGLKFFLDMDPEMPVNLELDEARLRHIIVSLMGNAVKFTSKGFILISCRKKYLDSERTMLDLIVTVEDTGSGLDEKNKSNFLQNVIQLKHHDDLFAQSGFGLSITKRLLYLMNGEIEIHSSPGRGTVVKIKIPGLKVITDHKNNEEILESNEYMENISADDFSQSAILLISNPAESSGIKKYFSDGPIHVRESSDLRQTKEALSNFLPDALLVIPPENDIESFMFIKSLKKSEEYREFPVILLIHEKLRDDKTLLELKKFVDEIIYLPMKKQVLLLSLARYLPFREQRENDNLILDMGGRSVDEMESLSELLQILQNKMRHVWEKVSNLLVKSDIEQFAEEITELGRQYNYRPLYKWGSDLNSQVQVFDTISILNMLKEFPHIVNLLKNQTIQK
ncbi:MAG: ATP-binding protein [Spirochaetia bacterium]|nr:ATP-binding protein [Spirochaetia bacterium]